MPFHFMRPTQTSDPDLPPPADDDKPPLAAFGCAFLFALAFLVAGTWPLLALFGVFPREAYFGDQSPLIPVVAGLGFLAVGIYLMSNLIRAAMRRPPLSGRLVGVIVALTLAIPLHWWLFFGTSVGASRSRLRVLLFEMTNSTFDFILAKITVALLSLVLDLVLVSELFGLGWFSWRD